MNRREFIAGVASLPIAAPFAARAQQLKNVYRIGVFSAGLGRRGPAPHAAFTAALRGLGWIEGENVVFEHRYAANRPERLPELAAELVALRVDVIAVSGTLALLAAKKATSTIPIVMFDAGDPVRAGIVASFARPGGNITGLTI